MQVSGYPVMSATTVCVDGASKEDEALLAAAKRLIQAHIEHVKVGTDTLTVAAELQKLVQADPSIRFFEGTS